jgi:O-antigen biosynthesis protein
LLQARDLALSLVDYGPLVDSPQVSIVVPLQRRIDLVEHQLAQFVHDPEVRSAELIYVLDSPELEKPLAQEARQLFKLYRVPFRVLTIEGRAGVGAARNAGASVARGRMLLLLDSTVLPDVPGWLGTMQRFYDSKDEIGALGPKLLGLDKDLPAADVARPVPSVTATCLMIERELYERVGGSRDILEPGEHDGSDLCLRLLEAGRENWYLPDAELYHLEGLSRD